jgi:adenylate cyclase
LTFMISVLLDGSSVGRNAKTNLLSVIFVGTFLILAVFMAYASLKNKRGSPAPRAQARPQRAKKKKLNASKYLEDAEDAISKKKKKKKKKEEEEEEEEEELSLDEEDPDEDETEDEEDEEDEEEESAEAESTGLSPHGEKQKVYLMQYLGQALAQVQASEVTLDAFNKFGINLFLAGACEILNEKRNVDPRDSTEILAEAVTVLGFKKEEASSFSEKYQEYLLADARYMQIFQAGRNAMNTYFTEEASGVKQMTVAMEDWNKPKQKEENAGPVTVMFTDIVGSTAMTQDLGDAVAQQIVRAHNRIIREALTKFAGKEIKHTGDGIMASFPITSQGVEASMDMQRNVMVHNEANPDLPLHIKIGLNAGEPIAEDNDLFGTTVQMAARIVDKAQTEQIFVSEIVQGICSGKEIKFENRGGFPMKGFENDPTLYEVIWNE